MDPDRWARVKAAYHSALGRDPSERSAFLKQACGDDREILVEVESLLAQASDDSFLERPAWQAGDPGGDEPGPVESAAGYEHPAGPQAEATATRRHPFLWVVWLVTAGVIAGLGYAAWRLPQDVPAFGWSEARRGGLWRVTGVSAAGPAAGKLQPGDILLSLNGDVYVAWSGTLPYRRVLGAGASYRIQVGRGGATVDYALRTDRTRPNRLPDYMIGLAWCAIGLFIGFARPQDGLARLAFAASTLTGLSFLGVVVPMPLYALQPWHVLGYHFFYRFPGEPPRAKGVEDAALAAVPRLGSVPGVWVVDKMAPVCTGSPIRYAAAGRSSWPSARVVVDDHRRSGDARRGGSRRPQISRAHRPRSAPPLPLGSHWGSRGSGTGGGVGRTELCPPESRRRFVASSGIHLELDQPGGERLQRRAPAVRRLCGSQAPGV